MVEGGRGEDKTGGGGNSVCVCVGGGNSTGVASDERVAEVLLRVCLSVPLPASCCCCCCRCHCVWCAVHQLNETLQCRAKSKGQGGAVTEALSCVGVLARALHLSWQPYAQQLLSVMMLTGPSQVGLKEGGGRLVVREEGGGKQWVVRREWCC